MATPAVAVEDAAPKLERFHSCVEQHEPCTVLGWLEELLSLPHYCRDSGRTGLDVDKASLLDKLKSTFANQLGGLVAATTWKEWTASNAEFCDALEKMFESMAPYEPDLQDLAGTSLAYRHQLQLPARFTWAMQRSVGLDDEFRELLRLYGDEIDTMVKADRDFNFALKGASVMITYSMRDADGKRIETPQYVYLRCALGVHKDNLEEVKTLYDCLSTHCFSAPSPALAYACQAGAKLATCFTLSKPLKGIDVYDVLQESAQLSFGSCGIHFHEVPKNQVIAVAKLFDAQAKLSGKTNFRMPAQSIYLEPWHDGIEEYLGLRKVLGPDETVCRDMHLGLWVPDEFMRRVRDGEDWPMFCPSVASDLANCYGDAFVEKLNKYVEEGKHSRLVPARSVWRDVIASQIECGEPTIMFKDHVNTKSNEEHIGAIRGSNLCAEIVQFCDATQTTVCCVMTLSFPKFIKGAHGERYVDFVELRRCAAVMQRMADSITECVHHLPSVRAQNAGRTRSLGLGGQGLADALQMMNLAYDSDEGIELNARLFEHLYFACLESSADLAEKHGPYEFYSGSNASEGRLQWHLWERQGQFAKDKLSKDLDWDGLLSKIKSVGLRNSHCTAQPPTAASAAIMGNNEGAEPFTSNMYTRSDFFGDFWVLNRHLVADLKRLGKYTNTVAEQLIRDKGSVQYVDMPEALKNVYRTAWEMADCGPDIMVRHSAARGPFIDQAESFNLFLHDGSPNGIEASHFAAWNAGLKTGMYYLVMRPAREAVAFTVSFEREISRLAKEGQAPLLNRAISNTSSFGEQPVISRVSSTTSPGLGTPGLGLSRVTSGTSGAAGYAAAPTRLSRVSSAVKDRFSTSEPLLQPNVDRNVLFPIRYHDVWDMYKQASALLWTADELDYAADVPAFKKLDAPVQKAIKTVLAFFAVADGVVNENCVINFGQEIEVPEVRAMYSLQAFVEEIHAETYSRLLLTLVEDPVEQTQLLTAHRNGSDSIGAKVRWAENYMTAQHSFPQRLLAFACVEGIMFSASFAIIFYLKSLKVNMPALTNSNELISRDEGLHRDFAVLLYKKHVKNALPSNQVRHMIRDAVSVEKAFVDEAFGADGLVGMTTESMKQYVEVVGDHLIRSLGHSPIFNAKNPFPWMDMISSDSKTDRFGKRNTAYRQPGEMKLNFGGSGGASGGAPMNVGGSGGASGGAPMNFGGSGGASGGAPMC